MRTRLALLAIITALVLSAFGASPASPANDPQNFRASLHVTVTSCEGGTIPECRFDGRAVVPQLGSVGVTGVIVKGCNALYTCLWLLNVTLTPVGTHGGRTLVVIGDAQWASDFGQPPAELPWQAQEDSGYTGDGTSTDDFAYQPYGSEFTINLIGTLRQAK
jgi:hypothetical protein